MHQALCQICQSTPWTHVKKQGVSGKGWAFPRIYPLDASDLWWWWQHRWCGCSPVWHYDPVASRCEEHHSHKKIATPKGVCETLGQGWISEQPLSSLVFERDVPICCQMWHQNNSRSARTKLSAWQNDRLLVAKEMRQKKIKCWYPPIWAFSFCIEMWRAVDYYNWGQNKTQTKRKEKTDRVADCLKYWARCVLSFLLEGGDWTENISQHLSRPRHVSTFVSAETCFNICLSRYMSQHLSHFLSRDMFHLFELSCVDSHAVVDCTTTPCSSWLYYCIVQ